MNGLYGYVSSVGNSWSGHALIMLRHCLIEKNATRLQWLALQTPASYLGGNDAHRD